jgi:hypothetical protein
MATLERADLIAEHGSFAAASANGAPVADGDLIDEHLLGFIGWGVGFSGFDSFEAGRGLVWQNDSAGGETVVKSVHADDLFAGASTRLSYSIGSCSAIRACWVQPAGCGKPHVVV